MRRVATVSDMAAKLGRNDPCFCGSGKKYKHCHGALTAEAAAAPALGRAPAPTAQTEPTVPQLLMPEDIGSMVRLVEAGRLSEAEAAVRAALRSHSNAGILWKILSVALVRQGKDALEALRRAAEQLPNDAEALRNLGAALHDRGMWSEALVSLQQALAIEPNDADALVDTADALRGLGRAREAIPLYQRALSISAKSVEAQNNLGNAYLELAQYEEAARSYRLALVLKPQDAQIQCNLGNALRQQGQLDEALTTCRQAVARDPGLSVAHNNLGTVLAALGQRTEAVASYRQALQLNPAYVEALNNQGNVLRDLGDRRGAAALFTRAVELDPQRAESHNNLGNVLFEMRKVDQAVASFRQALALQPDFAPAHLSLAFALRQQRRAAEAETSCRAALAINPNYAEALSFLGELQADRGQFEEAGKLFRQAIDLNPRFAFAVASLATHRKMTMEDTQWLHGAQALLAQPLPLGQEISLRYSLGKFFDDTRQYDAAFTEYRQANELTKRYGIQYNRAGLTQHIEQLMRNFDAARLAQGWEGASTSEVPILIVGMPRSGTSLAEQILASHPQIFGGGEVTFWNAAYDAYRDAQLAGRSTADQIPGMARDYLQQLASMSGTASRVVDKLPANFMYVGLIHAAFPKARIIHMQRHPADTCLSIYFQNFFNIGPYANDLDDLAHYYGEYVRITRHWRETLPEQALLEVPYEALISDQETWTRRMLEFVGVPWDPRCLDFHRTDRVVITASKWQVRQKINATSAGRWRNYEKYVEPLRRLY